MNAWNDDVSLAPRGHTVPVRRIFKGKEHAFERLDRELVWLATKCGQVVLSYWVEPTQWSPGRWCMIGTHETPVAWRPFVEGEFPSVKVDEKRTWPNGKAPTYPMVAA